MDTKLTRRAFLGATGMAGLTLAACGGGETTTTDTGTAAEAIKGTYAMHIQGYDWGCGVDKVTVSLDSAIDAIDPANLEVSETKMATDFTDQTFPIVEATIPRPIKAATLSDDGKTIELELACAPNDGDTPLTFSMITQYNTWSDPYYLTIAAAEGAAFSLDIAQDPTEITTSADAWAIDEFKAADGVSLKYALFTPEADTETLVVWLHGLGEGGTEATDPRITLLGNKVVALSEEGFQQTVGGAYVLAPQCPTFWMDVDGKASNFVDGGIKDDGTSFYTPSVEELIDKTAADKNIKKIVLAGCSNGGYMTMVLSINRPDAYKCVVPICEAVSDKNITDEQIKSLKDLPMYFVYSKDDTTVDPTVYEEPTIKRLKDSGKSADTLHVSTTDHVVDTSGEFKGEDGGDYTYMGHWSWIYFFNNECECDEDSMKAWDFIAEYVK